MQQQRLAAAAGPHMLHAPCVWELEWGLWWGVTSAAHGELYLDAHKPPQALWLVVGVSLGVSLGVSRLPALQALCFQRENRK